MKGNSERSTRRAAVRGPIVSWDARKVVTPDGSLRIFISQSGTRDGSLHRRSHRDFKDPTGVSPRGTRRCSHIRLSRHLGTCRRAGLRGAYGRGCTRGGGAAPESGPVGALLRRRRLSNDPGTRQWAVGVLMGLQQPLASRCPGAVPGVRRRRPSALLRLWRHARGVVRRLPASVGSRCRGMSLGPAPGVKRACSLVCFQVCCWYIGHARAAEPT
jgi:hypothetical protein